MNLSTIEKAGVQLRAATLFALFFLVLTWAVLWAGTRAEREKPPEKPSLEMQTGN